jgi:hypothetical protein
LARRGHLRDPVARRAFARRCMRSVFIDICIVTRRRSINTARSDRAQVHRCADDRSSREGAVVRPRVDHFRVVVSQAASASRNARSRWRPGSR